MSEKQLSADFQESKCYLEEDIQQQREELEKEYEEKYLLLAQESTKFVLLK